MVPLSTGPLPGPGMVGRSLRQMGPRPVSSMSVVLRGSPLVLSLLLSLVSLSSSLVSVSLSFLSAVSVLPSLLRLQSRSLFVSDRPLSRSSSLRSSFPPVRGLEGVTRGRRTDSTGGDRFKTDVGPEGRGPLVVGSPGEVPGSPTRSQDAREGRPLLQEKEGSFTPGKRVEGVVVEG